MKWILLALVGMVLWCGCAGDENPVPASRLQHTAGSFSFVTPEGWSRTKVIGLDFVVVSTRPDAGAKPNIFVDFVEKATLVSNAVVELTDTNGDEIRGYEIVEQIDFVTESGMQGVRISAQRENGDGLRLALYHYLVQDADATICITGLCADSVKEEYEPTFDRVMKSLRSERSGDGKAH